ncbi:MAG: peptidoglycan editing factor PgeF [Nitrospiraceae bacterium]
MASGLITVPGFAGGKEGVWHFFGTRHQPDNFCNRVLAQRQSPAIVVSVKQVHGTDALILDRPVEAGTVFPGGWDALITNQPGVLLTVRTADCVPVLLNDPIRKVVAAVHAGWRGMVAGIIPKTISLLQKHFNSDPESMRIAIGPSAGPCCYEVDEQVLKPLRTGYPYWRSVLRETGRTKALLDLKELIRHQAQTAGLNGEALWTVNVCTICHPALFYSYRREGVVKKTMVSGIMLTRGTTRGHYRRVRATRPIDGRVR